MVGKERTIEEIEKELDEAHDESNVHFNKAPMNLDFKEFRDYMRPVNEKCARLSRELRMIKVPEFSDLSTYGDVMSLDDFKDNVKCGGFIDYDGSGLYVRDGKESDIDIFPSDIRHGTIRDDFDTIIWFNR